jgi:hypothetical protein
LEARARIDAALQVVGQRHGISDLSLDEGGACGLELKDGRKLWLQHDPELGRLVIFTALASIPVDAGERLALYELLLGLNCLEYGTEGGVLSVFHGSDSVFYHLALPAAALDPEPLQEVLEIFLARAERLAGRLLQAQTMPGDKPEPDPRLVGPGIFA